jgi:hypothetical protein
MEDPSDLYPSLRAVAILRVVARNSSALHIIPPKKKAAIEAAQSTVKVYNGITYNLTMIPALMSSNRNAEVYTCATECS